MKRRRLLLSLTLGNRSHTLIFFFLLVSLFFPALYFYIFVGNDLFYKPRALFISLPFGRQSLYCPHAWFLLTKEVAISQLFYFAYGGFIEIILLFIYFYHPFWCLFYACLYLHICILRTVTVKYQHMWQLYHFKLSEIFSWGGWSF